MNFKFNYLDYTVEVTRIEDHFDSKQWTVSVDGNYFCNIIKQDGLDFDKNTYRAYTSYGQRHHSGYDDETSIAELAKITMNWLY